MSLPDWTIVKSTASEVVNVTTAVTDPLPVMPILGTGSLHVRQLNAETNAHLYNTTYSYGMLHGRIRSLFQTIQLNGIGSFLGGIIFMQDSLNVTSSGSCYGVFISGGNAGTATKIHVRKYTAGLGGGLGSGTSLYASSSYGTTLGQPHALDVEWNATSGTDCTIIVRRAFNVLDFSTTILETSLTDSVAPHLTTVCEGLAFLNNGGTGNAEWLADYTHIARMF